MFFIIFNLVLLTGSVLLTYSGLSNFNLILTLPFGIKILIGLGLITPVVNLYDTIKNFVLLSTIVSEVKKEED